MPGGVKTAVQQYVAALQYASNNLKKDREIVKTAIQQDARSIAYVHIDLLNDELFWLNCIEINHHTFKYLLSKFHNEAFYDRIIQSQSINVDVTRKILKYHGRALRLASDEVKDNEELVSIAVESDGCALKYASDRLKRDCDLLPRALKSCAVKGCYCIMIPVIEEYVAKYRASQTCQIAE